MTFRVNRHRYERRLSMTTNPTLKSPLELSSLKPFSQSQSSIEEIIVGSQILMPSSCKQVKNL